MVARISENRNNTEERFAEFDKPTAESRLWTAFRSTWTILGLFLNRECHHQNIAWIAAIKFQGAENDDELRTLEPWKVPYISCKSCQILQSTSVSGKVRLQLTSDTYAHKPPFYDYLVSQVLPKIQQNIYNLRIFSSNLFINCWSSSLNFPEKQARRQHISSFFGTPWTLPCFLSCSKRTVRSPLPPRGNILPLQTYHYFSLMVFCMMRFAARPELKMHSECFPRFFSAVFRLLR